MVEDVTDGLADADEGGGEESSHGRRCQTQHALK